jgi:hypothetical protein
MLAFLTSGCATAQAKSVPGAPALDMPPPPPRVVDTTEIEPAPVPLPDEPARHTPPQTPRRTPPPRSDANRQPDQPATPPSDAPKPAAEPPKAPPTLQTTPADVEGKEEQSIRALLARANTDLSRVNYQRLNADARTQYDTAKRFVTQAEDALRTKNLVFARSVADKAATLAAQLAGK